MTPTRALDSELRTLAETRYVALLDACRAADVRVRDDAGVAERVQAVLAVSDFAYETLLREPTLLGARLVPWVTDPGHAATRRSALAASADGAEFGAALRRFRRRESLRLVWRDVTGIDSVPSTLAGATELAEVCLDGAYAHARAALVSRYGEPRNESGEVQPLVILGMGKLGGGELNFSSDIDLIAAFPESGHTDGARGIDNEDFFARLVQRMTQLLAEVTPEGFGFRVDLRLRPFGSVGRLALPFAAMELYYQREGRDWERYAWVKARPVAGDRGAGTRLLSVLAPFVYRRYLDYGAIDGLREMKALIDAEVARRDLASHVKLGPGGIREIEFLVQLAQLTRGGREPALRTQNLLTALAAGARLGYLTTLVAERLRRAYLYLRRVENRLQMMRDEQTHELPEQPLARHRLARGLGHADWDAFALELQSHRTVVAEEFAEVLTGTRRRSAPELGEARILALWRDCQQREVDERSIDAAAAPPWLEAMAQLARGPAVRSLGPRSRERLERVLPALVSLAERSVAPDLAATRALALIAAVAGRPTYLTLLDESPTARSRLIDVLARSTLLADRVIAHPLLLDDLLDRRVDESLPGAHELHDTLFRRLGEVAEADPELVLEQLAELRQSLAFRIGLAHLDRRHAADAIARALAALAESVLGEVLALALAETTRQHGALPGVGFGRGVLVVGYGSLGGGELGFASDLDLVFLYDGALSSATSLGARPVEGSRWFARVAQRVVHALTTQTRAGRLYEVDVRLRPDGAKGLLVSSLDAFADYQRERAWLWEHQALVRARALAGDADLARRFGEVRGAVLGLARDGALVRREVAQMRERWRAQLDRSDAARIDLKQGRGGLTDLEFMLQALVLEHAHAHPGLAAEARSHDLLPVLAHAGVLDAGQAAALGEAHEVISCAALDCTLDAAPRVLPRTGPLLAASRTIEEAWLQSGLSSGAEGRDA